MEVCLAAKKPFHGEKSICKWLLAGGRGGLRWKLDHRRLLQSVVWCGMDFSPIEGRVGGWMESCG
jgi:hypothetical protein